MKILILGKSLASFHGTSSYHLYKAIAEHSDCVFYGEDFNKETGIKVGGGVGDVLPIIDREKPDVIWIQWEWSRKPCGGWTNLDKVKGKIPIIGQTGDPWNNLQAKTEFNRKYTDLVLLDSGIATHPIWKGVWNNFPAILFHAAVNTDIFRPLDVEKKYDTGIFGARSENYYPFRHLINEELCRRSDINSFHEPFLNGPVATTNGFVRTVNECKTMICTGLMSPYNVFTHKYIEGMACGTMVLGEIPLDAEQLNFVDGVNIVSIDRSNFIEKIIYYRNHDDERMEIAEQGYMTVLRYHTMTKRARQFIGLCKLMLENKNLLKMVEELNYTYENTLDC